MFSGREKMKDIDGINRTNRKPRIMGIFIYTAEVYMMTEKVYIAKIIIKDIESVASQE